MENVQLSQFPSRHQSAINLILFFFFFFFFCRYFEDLDLDSYEDRLLFVGVKSPYTVETAYIEDMKELFRKSRLQIPSGKRMV